jgi:cell wall assembly regulator SMI1
MSAIVAECERIRQHHVQLGRVVADRLLPALSDEEISAAASDLGLVFPRCVHELYGWRNGTDLTAVEYDAAWFEAMIFRSLGDSVRRCRNNRQRVSTVGTEWQNNWFPLFDDGAGLQMAIECGASEAVDAPIHVATDALHFYGRAFDSLELLLRTMARAFEEGVFSVNELGWLVVDHDRFPRLAREANPGSSAYWSDPAMSWHLLE